MAAQVTPAEHGASPQPEKKRTRDPSNGDLRIVLDRVEAVGDRHDNQLADLNATMKEVGKLIVKALERIAFMVLGAFAIGAVAFVTIAGYGMYVGLPGLLQASGQ